MRRKLFLTFAMALAFLAGANAQQPWNMTLASSEGLPGNSVKKDDVTVQLYQSGIVKPEKAIESLRFTVYGTVTGEEKNGQVFFTLSELTVYTADRSDTIPYTVTTNAGHNELGGNDGGGLAVLNDGKYGNHFHSTYSDSPVISEPHYLELAFTEPVESFIIEWAGRAGSNKNNPNVVVLTEGGTSVEPYSDRTFELGEQIKTAANLTAAKYIVIRGNASETYDEYNRETGTVPDDRKGLEGCGPQYVTMGAEYAKEPTIDFVTELIPVPGKENKFYVYFPNQERYLNNNAADSGFGTAQNGDQKTTGLLEKASEVEFVQLASGDFEMKYEMKYGEGTYTVYIGADPRKRTKILSEERKVVNEQKGWCEGFSIRCAFNWTIYAADYQAPAWAESFKLAKVYQQVSTLKGNTDIPDFDITDILKEMEGKMLEDMTADATKEYINDVKMEINDMFYDILDAEYSYWHDSGDNMLQHYKNMARTTPEEGYCEMSAYQLYIEENIFNTVENLLDEADANEDVPYLYNNMSAVTAYFASKDDNISAFLASKYQSRSFGFKIDTDLKHLGSQQDDGRIVWEQTIMLKEPTDGFRMTFIETYAGTSANKYTVNGKTYDIVALAELEITNGSGEKITLTASTNSQETKEGPIEYLTDGIADDKDNFWHSIWSNEATMNPEGYVYLDIKFPDGVSLDQFTIKTTSREHQNGGLAPKAVYFTKYGVVYNPLLDRPNTYNVKEVKQITDPAELKENGLYIISGNLRVNDPSANASARFYSGNTPYLSEKEGALNDTCVYVLKKAADGNWNILSLAHGKYWAEDASMTANVKNAASIKFAKSSNMPNTMVLYSEINDTVIGAKWEPATSEGINPAISIDSTGVTVNRRVYMDWDGSLAERLCVSEQPGVFTHGYDIINEHAMVDKIMLGNGCSAGDYLHFNKMNGEGEWNVYEVTMDSPDFVYLKGLLLSLNNLDWVIGKNPGCIDMSTSVKERYETAKAAAEVTVNENGVENATAVVKELVAAFEAADNSKRVGFLAGAEYAITNAFEGFYNNNKKTRSLYAKSDAVVEWTNTPEDFKEDNTKFLWKFTMLTKDNMGSYEIEVPENEIGKAYFIKNVKENAYIGDCINGDNAETAELSLVDIEQAKPWVLNNVGGDMFNITQSGTSKNLHANKHNGGAATEGNIMFYGSTVGDKSVWRFQLVNDDPTSVEDVVVEGDEVVAVEYYTPAGVAIAAPAKGINIIIKRYANGVVEAAKVIVK